MSTQILPSTIPPSPFDEALQSFQARLSAEQKQLFGTTTRKDIEILAIKLQEEQKQRGSHKALGLLRPFIDGLSGYAKVIEVFAQTSEILCFVWGPIKFLLQIGTQWQTAIDKLLDALSEVGEKLLLFEKYSHLIIADPRFRGILVRVYSDILELLWTAIRVFGKKTRTYEQFLRIHSPVFDKKLGLVLSNLENDQKLIRDAVSITHFDEAMRLHAMAEKEFKAAAKHRLYSTLQIFRQELQPALLSTPRLEAARGISTRTPATGDWLKNHQDFIAWKTLTSQVDPVLVLYGIPGAGKTTLSSIIFNQLENELLMSPGRYSLAHLALGFQSRQNNDCNTALKSLLYDQLAKYPDYAETILEVLGGEFVQKLGATEILQQLLQEIFHFHRPVFLFIDGIDELSNDSEIRKFLGIMESFLQNCTDIRLFVSCRPEELIRTRIRKLNATEINLSDTQNRQDITAFVSHTENLDFLVQECGYESTTATRYLNAIIDKADGMFLYAKLLVSDLTDLLQGLDIETLIRELPTGLDQAYERSLQRIASLKKPLRRQAKTAFRLLIGGASALRVLELQQAVLIEPAPNKRQFQIQQKCSLGLLCGSLVEIMNDDTVCLVHASLREYLLEKDNTLGFRYMKIHRSISILCYDYLSNLAICGKAENAFENLLKLGGLVFLSYACKNLTFHLQEGIKNFDGAEISDAKTNAFIMMLNRLSQAKPLSIDLRRSAPLSAFSAPGPPLSPIEEFSKSRVVKIVSLFQNGETTAKDHIVSSPSLLSVIRENIIPITQKFNASLQHCAANCDPTQLQSIVRIYGPPFRCTDIQCVHFYLGFPQIAQKIQHVASHRREFKCPVPTCPYHELGFSSSDHLNQHDVSTHRALTLRNLGSQQISNRKIRNIGVSSKSTEKFSELVQMAKDALSVRDTAMASDILNTIFHQHLDDRVSSSNLSSQTYRRTLGRSKKFIDEFNAELTLSPQTRFFDRICWPPQVTQQSFTLATLLDYLLFYGDEKVLNGSWSKYIIAAINIKDDPKWRPCLFLPIIGENVPAIDWIFVNVYRGSGVMLADWAADLPRSRPEMVLNKIDLKVWKSLIPGDSNTLGGFYLTIGFLVEWADNESLVRIIQRHCPHVLGGVGKGYFDSPEMALLAVLFGHRKLINSIFETTSYFKDSLIIIRCILAWMVSSSMSSQDRQESLRDICIYLKTKGTPFWQVSLSDVIRIALPASLIMEGLWSAQSFLQSLNFCLDLGVSPTDLKELFECFQDLELYTERRLESHPLDAVSIDRILGLIRPIMEMGVCSNSSIYESLLEPEISTSDYFDARLMVKYPSTLSPLAVQVHVYYNVRDKTPSRLPRSETRFETPLTADYDRFTQNLESVRRSVWAVHRGIFNSWMDELEVSSRSIREKLVCENIRQMQSAKPFTASDYVRFNNERGECKVKYSAP